MLKKLTMATVIILFPIPIKATKTYVYTFCAYIICIIMRLAFWQTLSNQEISLFSFSPPPLRIPTNWSNEKISLKAIRNNNKENWLKNRQKNYQKPNKKYYDSVVFIAQYCITCIYHNKISKAKEKEENAWPVYIFVHIKPGSKNDRLRNR